jgi:hypothetical protein
LFLVRAQNCDPPEPVSDIAAARRLLAEADHAGGVDAGAFYCDAAFSNVGEAVVNNLREAGIHANLRVNEPCAPEQQFRLPPRHDVKG